MAIKGQFNTDAKALNRRICAHDKYGTKDINEWIFRNLGLARSMSILDLGCGTGKQTIPLAKLVGHEGAVLSVDISQEALNVLLEEATKKGLSEQVTALCCSLDDVHIHLQNRRFDRVLSSYSLYYAQDPGNLIKTIWEVLKPGGHFFFCGPARDNNGELKAFHYSLEGVPVPPENGGSVFMEEIGQRLVREVFPKVEVTFFENPLRFTSPEALHAYWSSYNLYEDKLDDSFKVTASEHFNKNAVFITKKRVIGIKAVK